MCGRVVLERPGEALHELFGLDDPFGLEARYNLAPSQLLPAVRVEAGERRAVRLKWGLVPRWAREERLGPKPINARGETVAEKPAFRGSFRDRRCLVPVDGFYEWEARARGPKIPHVFRLPGDAPFAIAALWERWTGKDGVTLETCALVTTAADEVVGKIHDRMPVIVPRSAYATWLESSDVDALRSLFETAPSGLVDRVVGRRVNDVRNDDPDCLRPAE